MDIWLPTRIHPSTPVKKSQYPKTVAIPKKRQILYHLHIFRFAESKLSVEDAESYAVKFVTASDADISYAFCRFRDVRFMLSSFWILAFFERGVEG